MEIKYIIEKELCNPVNGEILGPFYHLYEVNGEEKTLLSTTDDICAAARELERKTDLWKLEVAYQENPDVFKSNVDNSTARESVLKLQEIFDGSDVHVFKQKDLEKLQQSWYNEGQIFGKYEERDRLLAAAEDGYTLNAYHVNADGTEIRFKAVVGDNVKTTNGKKVKIIDADKFLGK